MWFVYYVVCLDLTLIQDTIVKEKQESLLGVFWNSMVMFYLF